MGSPAFSLPILSMLAAEFDVVGVVTQPDRPRGRGKHLQPSPVKVLAQGLGLPIIQPAKLRNDIQAKKQLASWQPAVIVVAAFGQILKTDVLTLPTFGCINVHTSLLPRWRGASPIESAILSGDTVTGVTIMQMDEGMDTGPILAQQSIAIDPEWRASELESALSNLGASLLKKVLPDYLAGQISPVLQPTDGATHAPLLRKEDGKIDPDQCLAVIMRQIRAYYPWPGATIPFGGQPLKIIRASGILDDGAIAGCRAIRENLPAIGCADGWILCEELQPAGRTVMSGSVFLRGYRAKWLEGQL